MKGPIDVRGAAEVGDALRQLEKTTARKIIRKGLRAGGKVVQSAAKAEAPELSGRTKRNIKIRARKAAAKGAIAIGVGVGAKDFKGETFYAGFVLYGHFVGSRKLGNSRRWVKPNNFLARAYETSATSAADACTDSMLSQIEAAAANKGNG